MRRPSTCAERRRANAAGLNINSRFTNPLYPYWGMDATQPAFTGGAVFIDATAVDADLDTLYYLWTLEEQPAGSTLPTALTSSTALFTPTVAGTYRYTLAVSDGVASAAPKSVTINVVNESAYPSLKLAYVGAYTGTNVPVWFPYRICPTFTAAKPGTLTFPFDALDTTSQGFGVIYRLTASGGDYTVTNPSAITDWGGGSGQAQVIGLSDGQVIHNGESVNFALISPVGYSLHDAVSGTATFTWSFKIKERPDWYFKYVYRYPRPL